MPAAHPPLALRRAPKPSQTASRRIHLPRGVPVAELLHTEPLRSVVAERAGLRIEATAVWEGESNHIVQVGANKAVLKETYSLVGDGDRMAFIFILESKLSEAPIQFRVVYDRVEDD